jgi:hypothetical protein
MRGRHRRHHRFFGTTAGTARGPLTVLHPFDTETSRLLALYLTELSARSARSSASTSIGTSV